MWEILISTWLVDVRHFSCLSALSFFFLDGYLVSCALNTSYSMGTVGHTVPAINLGPEPGSLSRYQSSSAQQSW